ncbi:Peroxisome assembly protein 12 [Seminavis robusta]|uniref:Peroxin-12 n=1 Tax=Seminavis robusta TaxID=568900 RepID=A0A9N8H8C7_9STRA|nr:Peroxisome assembly protein 12 [Seminavis robusta]|eukprot:Sro88_g046430.1 Peroxisome assembly protein 12 (462) ;mRNA; r:43997-45382
MMDESVNPAIPTTAGALLAEEWTINPLATLPSFLEMFMMDEASRSARKSLQAGMTLLQQKLAEQAASTATTTGTSTTTQNDSNGSAEGGLPLSSSSSFSLSYVKSWLQKSSSEFAGTIAKWLERFGPEISCLVLFLLERHCLRSQACATISESLYGGRQAKLDRSTDNNNTQRRKLLPLSDKDRTRLALLVALGPYLRHRMLGWFHKLKSSSQATSARRTLLLKLQKTFVWVYPLLHVWLSSLDLFYQWRYLLGHSVFFHPTSHLLGLVVRRVTQEDNNNTQKSATSTSSGKGSSSSSSYSPTRAQQQSGATKPMQASSNTQTTPMRQAAVWALSSALVLSWMSHFRSEYRRQRQGLIMEQQQQQQQSSSSQLHNYQDIQTDLSLPAAPTSGIKHSMPSHLCPLCQQPRVHPTASSSGFVFCYKCLLQHVQQTGQCPVTGRTCQEAQLLRLYEPNHSTTIQ